jgi:magnesium chelatase family protein
MYQVNRYQQKMSGPILDRIDLHVTVDTVDYQGLLDSERVRGLTSKDAANLVQRAWQAQASRYGRVNFHNSDLSNRAIRRYCQLTVQAKELLATAGRNLSLSARSYMRVMKVSQTIADLEAADAIDVGHVAEALQYRPQVGLA